REQEGAHERERDADRADEQVLPRRLERAPAVVVVDERRAGERRRLDRRPEQREVLADRDQRHRGEEPEQAGGEGALGPAIPSPRPAEVEDDEEEQQAEDPEEQEAERVQRQPAAEHGRG